MGDCDGGEDKAGAFGIFAGGGFAAADSGGGESLLLAGA